MVFSQIFEVIAASARTGCRCLRGGDARREGLCGEQRYLGQAGGRPDGTDNAVHVLAGTACRHKLLVAAGMRPWYSVVGAEGGDEFIEFGHLYIAWMLQVKVAHAHDAHVAGIVPPDVGPLV